MRSFAVAFALMIAGASIVAAEEPQDAPPAPEVNRPAPTTYHDLGEGSSFEKAMCADCDQPRRKRRFRRADTPAFFGDLMGSAIVGIVETGPPQNDNVLVFLPNVQQASAIKISEGDSPRPDNRFYYLFSFYGDVMISPTTPLLQVGRHVLGFEKTLFGSNFSIGMRFPWFSYGGAPAYDNAFVGDITVITKFALINNRETGSVLSLGLSLTTPSGGYPTMTTTETEGRPQAGPVGEPRDRAVIFQPYVGYIFSVLPRIFVQGFHSLLVPTVNNEPTFMANDFGLGIWAYRNPDGVFLRGISPIFEIHVNTPFNHRETPVAIGQTQMIDSVTLTTGVSIYVLRAVIGGAIGTPLGNSQNRVEAILSAAIRF